MSSIISKADFFNRAMAELEQYPALAARLKAGDVTITQQFGAMASMMAMLSIKDMVKRLVPQMLHLFVK